MNHDRDDVSVGATVDSTSVEDEYDENGKLKPKGQQPNANSKFALKKPKKEKPKKKDDLLTQRGAMLKLELGGVIDDGIRTKEVVLNQLDMTANHLFNIKDFPTQKSKDSNQWYATDEILYKEAKASYDKVMDCFEDDPRTYKFESTKENIWKFNNKVLKLRPRRSNLEKEEEMKPQVKLKKTKALGRKAKKDEDENENNLESESYKPLTLEEHLGTYIDPYQVPKPWRVEMKGKTISYYNEVTRDRVYNKPAEIWSDKLYILEHLTPRDDLDGYEYKETDAEKRKRLRIKVDYDNKMAAEIQRRIHQPTDIEIVEDCLFDIVETIAIRDERELKLLRNKEKRKERARWNVLCSGYPMKPLGKIENEDGDVEIVVSDHPFVDMIISPTGLCVPEVIDSKTLVIHEKEREDARKRKAIEDELELMERKKPIADKIGDVLDLARQDTSLAKLKLIEIIKKDTQYYIQKLREIDTKLMVQALKMKAVETKDGIVKFSKDPIGNIKHSIQVMSDLYATVTGANKDEIIIDVDQLMNEFEGKVVEEVKQVETDDERFERLCKLNRPIPIKHADRIMIKMTLMCEPPPLYIRRPPPGWEDDVRAATEKISIMKDHLEYGIQEKIIEPILDEDEKNPHITAIKKVIRKMKEEIPEKFNKFKKLLPPISTSAPTFKSQEEEAREDLIAIANKNGEFEDLDIKPFTDQGKLLNLVVSDSSKKASFDMATYTDALLTDDKIDSSGAVSPEKNSVTLVSLKKKKKKKKPDDTPSYLKATNAKYGKFNYNIKQKLEPIKEKIAEAYDEHMPDSVKETFESLNESIQRLVGSVPDFRGSLRDAIISLPGGEDIVQRFPKFFNSENEVEEEVEVPVKLIHDTSFRKQFEDQLINDISRAVCLPISNISIEEIRHLPTNHYSLIELEKKRKKLMEQFDLQAIELKKLKDRDEAYRTALATGHVTEFLRQEEIIRLNTAGLTVDANGVPIPLINDKIEIPETSLALDTLNGELVGVIEDDNLSASASMCGPGDGIIDPLSLENGNSTLTIENINALVGSEDKVLSKRSNLSKQSSKSSHSDFPAITAPVEVKDTSIIQLMESMIRRVEYSSAHPDYESLEVYDFMQVLLDKVDVLCNNDNNVNALVIAENNIALVEDANNVKSDGKSDNKLYYNSEIISLNDDFMELTKKHTISEPAQFKIGIVNVDELKNDKNYWLAKQLKTKSAEELRQIRIKRLKLSFKEKSLEEKIQEIKRQKSELIADAKEFLDNTNIYTDPLVEDYEKFDEKYLEPVREDLAPYIKRFKEIIEPYRQEAEKHFNIGKKIVLSKVDILSKYTKQRLEEILVKKLMLGVLKGLPGSNKEIQNGENLPEGNENNGGVINDSQAGIFGINGDISQLTNRSENSPNLEGRVSIGHPLEVVQLIEDICNTIQNDYDREQSQIKLENIEKLKQQEDEANRQMEELQKQIEDLNNDSSIGVATLEPIAAANTSENETNEDQTEDSQLVTINDDKDIIPVAEVADESFSNNENVPNSDKRSDKGSEIPPQENLDELGGDAWFEKRRIQYMKDQDYLAGVVNTIHLISLSIDMGVSDEVPPSEVYADLNDFYNDDQDDKVYRTKIVPTSNPTPTVEENAKEKEIGNIVDDKPTNNVNAEDDEDKPKPLIGCTVHFMIYVNDVQRQLDGLEDIEAEDIGVMLMEQFQDANSTLRAGQLTQHILDVSYKVGAKKVLFEKWESFWVNIIHPAFFGYVTKNEKKPPKPPENEYTQLGIKITNPISELDERNKTTWLSLEKKSKKKVIAKPVKSEADMAAKAKRLLNSKMKGMEDDDEEEKPKVEEAPKKEKQKSLLDLGEEEVDADFALDSYGNKKAVLFRPNMAQLTKKDVLKCMRVYQAMEDTYQAEMKRGLIDGQRISNAQYTALRERDQALRIYSIAKQKYSRTNKESNEFEIPPPEITKISAEQYNEWVLEARDEEERHLKEERKAKLLASELRMQENEIKKNFGRIKSWFQGKFVKLCKFSADMGFGVKSIIENEEMLENKFKCKTLSEDETAEYIEKKRVYKEILISEEKNTRVIFQFILNWNKRTNRRKGIVGLGLIDKSQASNEVKEIEDGNETLKPIEGGDSNVLVSIDNPTFENAKVNLPSAAHELVMEFVNVANHILEVERTKAKLDNYKEQLAKLVAEHEKRVKSLEESLKLGGGKTKKVPQIVNEDIPRIEKMIETEEHVHQAAKDKLAQISSYKLLIEDELVVARDTKWLETVAKYFEFYECLREFPTHEENKFAREDLVTFATLCCEFEPKYTVTLKSILDKRAAMEAAASLRLKQKQKEKVETEEEKAARLEKEMLEMEEKKRAERVAEAAERRKKRERAWLRAHPHIFVSIPGEYAFCVECKEREYDAWLEDFKAAEKQWTDSFDAIVLDMSNEFKDGLREKISEEYYNLEKARRLKGKIQLQNHLIIYKQELAALAAKKLTLDYEKLQSKIRNIMKKLPKLEPIPNNIEFTPHIEHLRRKDMIRMQQNYRNYLIREKTFLRGEDEEEISRKAFIPDYILQSGLSFVDWKGRRIVPVVKDIDIDPRTIPLEIDGNESDIDPDEIRNHTDTSYPITGVKLRVWHRELDGSRGAFMGQIKINHKEMMEPAKGIRTYPLTGDPRCVREGFKVEVQGTIAVIIKSTKINKKTGNPSNWRIEVVRCTKLATVVDDIDRSTPYVEILWRGIGEMAAFNKTLKTWSQIGLTKHKEKMLDPEWSKWDNNTYEVPPVWTELPIPGRGFGGEPLFNGGWVGKNMIPNIPPEDPEMLRKALEQAKKEAEIALIRKKNFNPRTKLISAISAVMACGILDLKPVKMIDAEEKLRLETYKFLREQEENERLGMTVEDIEVRRNIVAWEINRAQPYLERQTFYSREFTKLMRFIKNPPPMLSRLRFMMGEEMGGGGLRLMVQDPTTQKFLNLMAVPILYPEDEEQLVMQLNALIGKQQPNLLKIIDYSVHMIKFYNSTGFASVDERTAIILCDRYEGPGVMEYLNSKWESISNDDFRDICIQIVSGLAELHQEGILHRNLSERAFIVEVPKKVTIQTDGFNAKTQVKDSKRSLSDRPNVRVGEYLFLLNPRKQGCQYSYGRADWGDLRTRPPEAVGGHVLSDVSDMYAFGVCVYHWLTKGLNLPEGMNQNHIESLHTSIPLKWGSWVHSLLRMCLQENPKNRATAKEILLFLNNRLNKNKLNR